jgi:hypothetical protein
VRAHGAQRSRAVRVEQGCERYPPSKLRSPEKKTIFYFNSFRIENKSVKNILSPEQFSLLALLSKIYIIIQEKSD